MGWASDEKIQFPKFHFAQNESDRHPSMAVRKRGREGETCISPNKQSWI